MVINTSCYRLATKRFDLLGRYAFSIVLAAFAAHSIECLVLFWSYEKTKGGTASKSVLQMHSF